MIWHAVLAVVLGAVYCLGFAPFDLWPLTLVALGGLFYLLLVGPQPVRTAWLFGVGKYGFGASWVYVSIHVYGNAPPALAATLVVLFVFFMALFCVPVGWLVGRLRGVSSGGASAQAWLLAGAWLVGDWLLTWLLTGFPWLFPGYALMSTPLMGWAPVFGVLGMGLAALVSVGALVVMLIRRGVTGALLSLCVLPWLAGGALLAVDWAEPTERRSVALVQGNIEQDLKWRPEQTLPNVRRHMALTEPHWDADVIVWPEAAITLFPQQAEALLEQLSERAVATQTNFITGMPGADPLPEGGYAFSNLALGLGLAGGRFRKHHLVPFGDYVPLQGMLRGLIEFFDLPMSNAVPGPARQANLRLAFGEAAMAICYEIAYGDSMRRRAERADVLITITNDTWFGASIGPHQHMQIARMRAAENGRWLLRAANSGITAIVGPDGRERGRLPQFTADVLRGEIRLMQGRTPYSRFGDTPLVAGLCVLFAYFVWLRFKRET